MKIRNSKSPYAKAKKKAWDAFSRYIRLRDCLNTTGTFTHGKCITCGKFVEFKNADAGHMIAGRGNEVLIDEQYVNLQCKGCNKYKHGDPLTYRRHMVERYGEKEVQERELLAKIERGKGKKIYIHEWNVIEFYYKSEYKKLFKKSV